MTAGLLMVYNIPKLNPDGTVARAHFGGSSFPLSELGLDSKSAVYAGLLALLVNLVVAVVVTLILRAMNVDDGVDGTAETDYTAEREDPTVRDLPDPLASAPPGVAGDASTRR
jgi:SSS family solute:Na+ symporter